MINDKVHDTAVQLFGTSEVHELSSCMMLEHFDERSLDDVCIAKPKLGL